jgi:hypothetical protein
MATLVKFVIAGACFALATGASANCMQDEPYYWQGERLLPLYGKLMPFMTCKDYGNKIETALSDQTACNWFLARGLEAAYGYKDFTPERSGWKTANEIATFVSSSPRWEKLGTASNQSALKKAAAIAAAGHAVIATQRGDPHGHVALILPGPLSASGSWALQTPNSASFFIGRSDRSYVGCKLSYAFQNPSGVELYALK